MEEELVCENCESIPIEVPVSNGFRTLNLCPGCQEAYDEYADKHFGDSMLMTRDWLSYVNPDFGEISKLVVRIAALLRGIFPDAPRKDWRLLTAYKGQGTIALRIDKIISLRLVVGEVATAVMIAIENPISDLNIIGSIKRRAIRNHEWVDFFSWINNAKTWYDNRNEDNIKEIIQQGGQINEETLSNPLEWGSREETDNETGITATRTIKMKFTDNTGKKVDVSCQNEVDKEAVLIDKWDSKREE